MIEQDIARLWMRAGRRRTSTKDALAAQAELRALGINPNDVPSEAEVMAALESGAPSLDDARESDQVRGDEKSGAGGDHPSTPPPAASRSPSPSRCDGEELGAEKLRARPTRHNEWNPTKMVGFLRELAACQNVGQAARSVGMGRQSAYKLRARMAETPFSLAWEVALQNGVHQLAHALMDRALNGEEVPHYYQGERVATSRKFDNRLAVWLLENPGRLGREAPLRPSAEREWEELLERIETDSSWWLPGETLLCAPPELIADEVFDEEWDDEDDDDAEADEAGEA